jgi:multidrug transporter EmrE-like cation transporter
MKTFAFIIAATIFEAVGDAVMRIALHRHANPGRILLFVAAIVLLGMYGASLNLAPVEFSEATGIYIAALFVAFQLANYVFFHQKPTSGVMLGGFFVIVGAVIISKWK